MVNAGLILRLAQDLRYVLKTRAEIPALLICSARPFGMRVRFLPTIVIFVAIAVKALAIAWATT
jgi:hypothetical protein